MKFKQPTARDLQSVASDLSLDLDDAHAVEMRAFMLPLMQGYEFIEREDGALPEVKYPERAYEFPAPSDNPFGAWYLTSSIKGAATGPLAGRTVAIKDSIFVAGLPMADGTSFLEDFVPEFDATVVTRLLDAGAEITGKAACEYLCVSGGSATASSGVVVNPRKPGFSTGGSSSGSAALVAAGHVDMALGTDQAGSVRAPASWSGICGMKATFGLVPFTGAATQELSVDHIGPMTANVADNALLLEVLAGADGYDGRQQNLQLHDYTEALGRDLKGLRIGIVKQGFGQSMAEPAVDDCVRAAAAKFATLGAEVFEVSVPEHLSGVAVWAGILGDGLWQTMRLNGAGYNYQGVYSPKLVEAMQGWQSRLDETPINVRLLILMGKYLERYGGYYYAKAKNLARRLRRAYDAALSQYDLLLMPTTPHKATSVPNKLADLSDAETIERTLVNIWNTCQFDESGHPAMSIPCGLRDGLPIGMMLIAKHFDEPTIYRAAHAFEQSGSWQDM